MRCTRTRYAITLRNMANVKEILILFALIVACLFASCRTAKVTQTNDIQATTGTHADSTHTGGADVHAGEYLNHITHVYDSVFTHVTIYRYDTITQKVIEKVVIEQQAHHADNSHTIAGDTTHVIVYDSVQVARQDTAAYIDHSVVTASERRARGFLWGMMITAAVFGLFFTFYIFKR